MSFIVTLEIKGFVNNMHKSVFMFNDDLVSVMYNRCLTNMCYYNIVTCAYRFVSQVNDIT